MVSFSISYNSVYFRAYYCLSIATLALIFICMEYLFPSSYFQSVYKPEVISSRQYTHTHTHTHTYVLFLYPLSYSVSFDWSIQSIYI